MLKNNIMCLKPKIEKFNSFYNMDNKKNYKITEICDNKMLKNVGKIIDHIDDDIFKNDYYTFSNMYNAKKGLTIVYYNNPIGRRIIKKNICSTLMLRELRNIIYGNVYDDIDMKNSQVSIYINLIINLNLDISNYPSLLNCYNNKDYFINDITESLKTTDEREIKKALIKILNGGGHQNIPSLIPLKIEIENLYHNIKEEAKSNIKETDILFYASDNDEVSLKMTDGSLKKLNLDSHFSIVRRNFFDFS